MSTTSIATGAPSLGFGDESWAANFVDAVKNIDDVKNLIVPEPNELSESGEPTQDSYAGSNETASKLYDEADVLLTHLGVPSFQLSGSDLDNYFTRLTGVLKRMGLGSEYPDTQAILQHMLNLQQLARDNYTLLNTLSVSAKTGLPFWTSFMALGSDKQRSSALDIIRKSTALTQIAPDLSKDIRNSMKVDVIDPFATEKSAQVTVDRFLMPGRFSRTIVHLNGIQSKRGEVVQREGSRWVLSCDAEEDISANANIPFATQVLNFFAKTHNHDAVVGKHFLSASRGTLERIWMPGVEIPEWASNILKKHPDATVAELSLERFHYASTDEDSKAILQTYNDAFSTDSLAPLLALGIVREVERIFVCTSDIDSDLRQALETQQIKASIQV